MNGAQALMRTLVDAGVTVCFTNPGTSEMHFVAALDAEPRMRAVLTLFEGVATGAADGYARMTDRPAATLLHLGCGLGNGLANLHNARRAHVPLLNIVGDHATHHAPLDAPLQSDIETVARAVSGWWRTCRHPQELGQLAAQALAAAQQPPGQVATLILPADVSWGEGAEPAPPPPPLAPMPVEDDRLEQVARALASGEPAALLLGGRALRAAAQLDAARVAAACGARLLAETFPARIERGAGLPPLPRLAYLAELAGTQLRGLRHLVLVGARAPVSFFAYPGKPGSLVPPGCTVHTLAAPQEDAADALQRLAQRLRAPARAPMVWPLRQVPRPRGRLSPASVARAVAHVLPPDAILVDESQTTGVLLPHFTRTAPRHDVLTLTGGAIGQGLPNAVGAAIACPGRPVLALVGDGAAMYTPQALWTMAREGLHVVTVVLNNRAYAILNLELRRTGAVGDGRRARAQFDLAQPPLDFVALAQGMGVPAQRVATAEALQEALARALAAPGPHLIEAVLPSTMRGVRLRLLPYVLGLLPSLPAAVARGVQRAVAP
ncbi:putative acetolactate synthase large subunit IlvX [Tepidimonas sediminis]|uniref:Putative acetolactate synthase large subunit IlvX n=1 Tax=Tepidimonas sediminis TaxID=2588941 RepID=A0A554WHK6_9BURK|nr:acetolactate synthase large subunit [Tepidimonas sediminis]TSE23066.1 putative acetolactate synthase large subunit IlvX [Tepidimonas sediminis]